MPLNHRRPEGLIDRILDRAAIASAASTVVRVYDRADLLPQRAQALEAWAALVSGERGEVVNMQGAAPGA